MKKTMSIIALFTVVLVSLSAHTERVFEAAEGYNAPLFTLTKGDNQPKVSLADMKGQYVIVNFWSSLDPESRMNAGMYDRLAREQRLSLISVNFDRNEGLFREIAGRDGLNEDSQWHVEGDVARQLVNDYDLVDGNMRSFLIDPQGRVVAVNPDGTAVASIVRR